MASFTVDQAEGLRRMLGGKRPRVLTFLSTLHGQDKLLMLTNLCSSLASAGSDVILLDACAPARSVLPSGLKARSSLSDLAQGSAMLNEVVQQTRQGFSVVALHGTGGPQASAANGETKLARAFGDLAASTGTVIVDIDFDDPHALSLGPISEGEIVVQVTPDADSIKAAYGMIKHLNAQLGRRPFGILVTGATDAQARKIFDNMAATAGRYLAVSLELMGSVPADEHVRRAAGLGRPVTDAFPLAVASVAFRRLAQRFALSDSWSEASQPF